MSLLFSGVTLLLGTCLAKQASRCGRRTQGPAQAAVSPAAWLHTHSQPAPPCRAVTSIWGRVGWVPRVPREAPRSRALSDFHSGWVGGGEASPRGPPPACTREPLGSGAEGTWVLPLGPSPSVNRRLLPWVPHWIHPTGPAAKGRKCPPALWGPPPRHQGGKLGRGCPAPGLLHRLLERLWDCSSPGCGQQAGPGRGGHTPPPHPRRGQAQRGAAPCWMAGGWAGVC